MTHVSPRKARASQPVLDRHLREQEAAPGAPFDDEAVRPDGDLVRPVDPLERAEDGNLDVNLLNLVRSHGGEPWIGAAGCHGDAGHDAGERLVRLDAPDAAAQPAVPPQGDEGPAGTGKRAGGVGIAVPQTVDMRGDRRPGDREQEAAAVLVDHAAVSPLPLTARNVPNAAAM